MNPISCCAVFRCHVPGSRYRTRCLESRPVPGPGLAFRGGGFCRLIVIAGEGSIKCNEDRQTTSFIEILNRGRHPALWKWRLTPCGLHARTHARSLTVTQVILILSPSCPPPTPSLLPPSLLFASCYSLYAYSQLPTLASHSEEIIV